MERVIEERLRERRRGIEAARRFAECVKRLLGRVAVVVFGSYARGDFNEWSDVDVLVATERGLPRSPLERLGILEECLREAPIVEPIVLTLGEFRRLLSKRNPLALEAVERGLVLVDEVGFARLLRRGLD